MQTFTHVTVYVDVTPPVKGLVTDGLNPDEDERYSSEASTVASTWKNFSDPESGLKSYLINIYRKPAGKLLCMQLIHLLTRLGKLRNFKFARVVCI